LKKFKAPAIHYPLVLIVWDDAAGFRHGWTSKDEPLVPQLAVSVGFLIQETEHHILIAQDTDGDGAHNGRGQIPKGMVRSMKILKKANMPKPSEGARVNNASTNTERP